MPINRRDIATSPAIFTTKRLFIMILPLLVTLLVGVHAKTATDLANRIVSLGEVYITRTEAQNVSPLMYCNSRN